MKGIGTDRSESRFDSDPALAGSMSAHASEPDSDDVRFMRLALELAEKGAGQVAPNPKVGAVIVRCGEVVGHGWHARYGEAHAEVAALHEAGEQARGGTAYVSLEPCNHTGKTGPCTEALIGAGVARVVYAADDPDPDAAGGAARLRAAGVIVERGVLANEAHRQNAPFFFAAGEGQRPFVTLKLALSLDGALVDASRARGWLTGQHARLAVHAVRREADAIAVGIGTVLADDPALTVRDVPPPRVAPLRIVFDRRARLPLDSALVRTAHDTPVLSVTDGSASLAESALAGAGVRILPSPDLASALAALRLRGVRHLVVEGGATIASAFMADGLVDHLIIFQAPVILGAGALSAFAALPSRQASSAPRLHVLERISLGADLMTIYAVSGN